MTKNKNNRVSAEKVKELFYCDDSGNILWKVNVGVEGRIKAGTKAGSLRPDGYIMIHTNGYQLLAHRVSWVLAEGKWPEHHIDHINGDKTNNKRSNLREAPKGMNHQNQRKPQRNNKTGFLGVLKYRKGFRAVIRANGKAIFLGDFKSAEEAHAAYISAKRVLHEGCTI